MPFLNSKMWWYSQVSILIGKYNVLIPMVNKGPKIIKEEENTLKKAHPMDVTIYSYEWQHEVL